MTCSKTKIAALLVGFLIIITATIKITKRNDTSTHVPATASSAEKVPNWDLSDLYKGFDDPAWEKDKQQIKKDAEAFNKRYKGVLKAIRGHQMIC